LARDDPDTEGLLDPAAAGDEGALRLLLDRHRGRLRRMIAARLDPRLSARLDPSDVLQEALADAGRKLREYARERPLPFYLWLRRLAAERLVLAHRRHIRVAGRSVSMERTCGAALPGDESNVLLIDRLVTSGTSPTGKVRREELRQRVTEALAALGEIDREVLVLRYLEDMPFAEVAVVLGITENAAKVRHFRALERIRKLMDGESLG
jgi:RNA polymerase sigma-70 factor, ECF subfamily